MAEKRYTLVFYLAIVIGAIATFGVYRVLEATKASSRVATAPVVVAAADIPEGRGIDRVAVVVSQWPMTAVPAGAFGTIDSVAGRVARVQIFKGEAIVPGRLAPVGTGAGLEVKITPGKRAMGMRVNDVSGISGLIQPNSRVDLLVVIQNPQENRQVAKLFMSNMRVLSMGSEVQRGADGRPINATVATLEVTPEEAERLAVAQSQGQIQLVLRGYGDPDSIKTAGATSTDVIASLRGAPTVNPERLVAQRQAPRPTPRREAPAPQPVAPAPIVLAPPPPARPESATVQIFRGGKKESQKFAKDSAARDSAARARPTSP